MLNKILLSILALMTICSIGCCEETNHYTLLGITTQEQEIFAGNQSAAEVLLDEGIPTEIYTYDHENISFYLKDKNDKFVILGSLKNYKQMKNALKKAEKENRPLRVYGSQERYSEDDFPVMNVSNLVF